MGAGGVLNKMKSDGRGVQARTANAKEYLKQLRQEIDERKGKQIARNRELTSIEIGLDQSLKSPIF